MIKPVLIGASVGTIPTLCFIIFDNVEPFEMDESLISQYMSLGMSVLIIFCFVYAHVSKKVRTFLVAGAASLSMGLVAPAIACATGVIYCGRCDIGFKFEVIAPIIATNAVAVVLGTVVWIIWSAAGGRR